MTIDFLLFVLGSGFTVLQCSSRVVIMQIAGLEQLVASYDILTLVAKKG
eukprot:gene22528-28661_t